MLKLVGYDLELKNIVNVEIVEGKKLYFVSNNSEKKYVPNFIVENNNEIVDFIQITFNVSMLNFDRLNQNFCSFRVKFVFIFFTLSLRIKKS